MAICPHGGGDRAYPPRAALVPSRGHFATPNPLHRAARYLIFGEAPLQQHYPELRFSKALHAPTIVVRSTILAADPAPLAGPRGSWR